jgi:hypothetical protein
MTPQDATGRPAPRLTQADIDAIAECVVEQMAEVLRPRLWFGLSDAAEVARCLRVHENWVYAHAQELGAIRLGQGEKARLRFDLERVAKTLGLEVASPRRRARGRPRRHGLPQGVKLLEGRER